MVATISDISKQRKLKKKVKRYTLYGIKEDGIKDELTKDTLETLDRFTTNYTKDSLKEIIASKKGISSNTYKSFVIGYNYNKEIKEIEVLYEEDKKMLEQSYLRDLRLKHLSLVSNEDLAVNLLKEYSTKKRFKELANATLFDLRHYKMKQASGARDLYIIEGELKDHYNAFLGRIFKNYKSYRDVYLFCKDYFKKQKEFLANYMNFIDGKDKKFDYPDDYYESEDVLPDIDDYGDDYPAHVSKK